MGDESHVQRLLAEIQAARAEVTNRNISTDEKFKRFDELVKLVEKQQSAINSLSLKVGRPGADTGASSEREQAIALLEQRHASRVTKSDPDHPFVPDEVGIEEASLAIRAAKKMLKVATIEALNPTERKALSSFTLGSSGFILPPEMSSKILSCLVDPTDVTGLVANINISGPSIKFAIDNASTVAQWACEYDCWAPGNIKNLIDGLGEMEIKPESIRHVECANREFLEDSSVDVETWVTSKVSRAFRTTVSAAIMTGDGVGKPLGILHPQAGVPIVETGAGTPPGQIAWQDLILMKYEVPMQWHSGARYLMNAQTFALILTMSDALGRPIMISTPVDGGSFTINGSPVSIVSQMPDCIAGAPPVMFGNLEALYTTVTRKGVTLLTDPYSGGWCVILKFDARVGGAPLCPNAGRLLRIK